MPPLPHDSARPVPALMRSPLATASATVTTPAPAFAIASAPDPALAPAPNPTPAPGRNPQSLTRLQNATATPGQHRRPRSPKWLMLLTLTLTLLLLCTLAVGEVMGQINPPDGLRMPGDWNGFTNSTNMGGAFDLNRIDVGTLRWQTIFQNPQATGNVNFKFASTGFNNPWRHQWAGHSFNPSVNSINSVGHSEDQNPLNNTISLTQNNWYTVNFRDNGYATTDVIFIETSAEPVQITNVTQSPLAANVAPGQDLTVTVTTNNAPASDERLFVIYTTNNFASRAAVQLDFTDTTGTATIPGQTGGTNVIYYVMSTSAGVDLVTSGQGGDYYDMRSIRISNNNGSNFSYTVNTTWETATGATIWSSDSSWAAGQVPVANQPVTIAHSITLDTNPTVSALTINSGQELTFEDGQARELTISGGGSLTNNGTFTANDGKVIFSTGGSVTGPLTFNNVDIAGAGVNFGTASTLEGTLSINSGGAVTTNPPIYASGSTLRYNTGGTYNRGTEWLPASEGNNPYHVVVNADLNMFGHATPRALNGDLTLLENRSLTLSSNTAGTLNLSGDLIAQTGSSIATTSTDLVLIGTDDQNIDAPTGFTIPRLRFAKPSGDLTSTNNVTLTRLILRSGVYNLTASSPFTISTLDMSGGTLASNGFSANLGILALSGTNNSLIQLGGADAHTLTFGNSSGEGWSGSVDLVVEGWDGTPGETPSSDSDSGKLFFGNNDSGLLQAQLDQIIFAASPESVSELSTSGELLPGLAAEPISNSSSPSVQSFPTQVILSWSSGDGDRRLVVMRAGTDPVSFSPVDGTDYANFANGNFTGATEVGPSGEGNKIVYEGTGNSVLVSGLAQNTNYHIAIFEYNGQGEITNYFLTPLTFTAATAATSFTTANNGPWNEGSTWNNGVPVATTNVIIGHAVTIPADYTALAASVTITDNTGETPGISFDAANSVLEISNGGGLISTFVDDPGRFDMSDGGTVRFWGDNTVQGTFTFAGVSIEEGGLNFGTSSTLNGTLAIRPNGFVSSAAPVYAEDSTLFYDLNGASYSRTNEWPAASAGNSPFNVRINSALFINSRLTEREVRGDLTIEAGGLFFGALSDAKMDAVLTVTGDVTINGGIINLENTIEEMTVEGNLTIASGATIALSASVGGDLRLGGDFTNNGTFTPNDRAIFFDGSNGAQTISTVNGTDFPFWFISNEVDFNSQTEINSQRIELTGDGALNGAENLTVTLSGARRLNNLSTGDLVIETINADGTTRVTGAARANNFNYTPTSDLTFINVDADGDFSIGTLDTQTNIIKQGLGRLSLLGTVTNTGNTPISLINIDSGTLRLGPAFQVQDVGIGQIGIGSTVTGVTDLEAIFETEATTTFISPISVRTGGDRRIRFSNTEATPELSGAISLNRLLFVDGIGNGLLSGQVQNTEPFVKQGTGTVILSAANFQSGLFVDEGVLRLQGDFSFSNPAQGFALGAEGAPLNESNATLELVGLSNNLTRNSFEVRGGVGTRTLRFSSAGEIGFEAPISLGKDLIVDTVDGAVGVLRRNITGSNGLIKQGAGDIQFTISNAQENTFSGGVRLEGGGVRVGSGAVSDPPGTHSPLGTGTLTIASNNVTVSSSSGTARSIPVPVEVVGNFQLGRTGGAGNLTFMGNFNLTNATRTISVFDGTTAIIEGVISNGDLVKDGAGTMTLRGINTYGSTTIAAGTLRLGRTHDSGFVIPGAVTINSGATLNYSGTQNNQINDSSDVTIAGGTFTMGGNAETIGSLTITGGTLNRGGNTTGLVVQNNAELTGGVIDFSATNSSITFGDSLTLGEVAFNYISTSTANSNNNAVIIQGNVVVNDNTNPAFNHTTSTPIPRINFSDGTRTVTVGDNATLTSNWTIWGGSTGGGAAGLIKEGSGSLRLQVPNLINQGVAVNGGVLEIGNVDGLGTTNTSNNSLLLSNGALIIVNENVTLGSGRSVTISNSPTIQVADTRTFTIEGPLGETGATPVPLTKTGPGTLTLAGAASFTGATNVQAGILNVNGAFESTDLSIANGSQLNFGGSGGRALELTGFELAGTGQLNLTVSADTLIVPPSTAGFPAFDIPSDASVSTANNSRIVLRSGSVYRNLSSSTPTLRVEREFDGDSNTTERQGWRMLASPVDATYADMFDIGADPATFVTQGFTGATFPGRQFNLLWWDETDATGTTLQRWRIPGGINDTIPAGRGHFFYIFDGAPLLTPVNDEPINYPDNLPLTMSATGVEPNLFDDNLEFVNAGRFNFHVTFSLSDTVTVGNTLIGALVQDQGWNLIGNPTASWLNWNATAGTPSPWTKTEVSNVIYIWDPEEDDYVFTNSVTGTHDGFIAPFQAFWVQALAQNPVLSFTNAAKTVAPDINSGFVGRPVRSAADFGASDALGVSPNENPQSGAAREAGAEATVLPMRLRVAGSAQQAERETQKFVMLSEGGQFGADRWDAYRLQPMSDSWLTLASAMAPGSAPMVINSLPAAEAIGGPLNLPLYVGGATDGVPLAGQFTLEWELPADWDPDLSLVLMDHALQQAIPMRGTQRSYSFSHATDPGMLGLMVSPAPGDGSGFGAGPGAGGIRVDEPAPGPASARGAAVSGLVSDAERAAVAASASASASGARSGPGTGASAVSGGRRSVSASASGSRSGRVAVPLLPASLLGGERLASDWSPDFESAAAALPEGLRTATPAADDAHIPYIPLMGASAAAAPDSGTGTSLARSFPPDGAGAEARFSLFLQPVSGGPDADEGIPYTPIGISLAQNYPNPFNPATTVRFSLPEEALIRLEVFDVLGRRVTVLTNEIWPAGTHTLQWDATGHATGLYLLRLTAPATDVVQTRKMMLVR